MFLINLHFGRFRGSWLGYVWVVLGLIPAVIYISGFVLWYRRVLKKFL
ncbi:MAG: PepSY domain-containing protein [Pseudomonadales bacterium]